MSIELNSPTVSANFLAISVEKIKGIILLYNY
jgi:hypothetical protein